MHFADSDLWDQLSRSSARVPALISEGFGQVTDRQTADYYGRARGSAYESHTHLVTAKGRSTSQRKNWQKPAANTSK
ncbi:MAG: four helix bundle protein [Acidobacteria bacterium]|nr:MAG: four helix bundle protein [Acidobacteriota bacterium]